MSTLFSNKCFRMFMLIISLCVLISVYYYHFAFASPFARSWDEVDFVLALNQFDLFLMQPHFPGYPYFILGGTLIHQWVDNPAKALSYLNTLLSLSSILPVYLLARRYLPQVKSVMVTTMVHSFAYLAIMATEPMSEIAATALLWWYIWSLKLASEKKRFLYTIPPLILFSAVLGIRLSYVPFGIGILLMWWGFRSSCKSLKNGFIFLVVQIILAVGFQLIWVVGLMVSVGGMSAFFDLALGFAAGHFSEWGGAVTADSTPLFVRLSRLVFHNLFWVGLAGKSLVTAILLLFLGGFTCVHLYKRRVHLWNFELSLLVMVASYFLWALLAQNIDKPRHILPLIGLSAFLMSTINLKNMQREIISIMLILFICIFQAVQGYQLTKEKVSEQPATYQLAGYVGQLEEPFIIFTWEESRIMDYLQVPYAHKKVLTYDYFLSQLDYYDHTKVYVTNHVVDGFKKQGIEVKNALKKVETFHSNPLYGSVYSDITLYEWTAH